MEAGLFTTTKSSSMCTILISSADTGTSCLKERKFILIPLSGDKKLLFVGNSKEILLLSLADDSQRKMCYYIIVQHELDFCSRILQFLKFDRTLKQ